jgi:hypothetical protein
MKKAQLALALALLGAVSALCLRGMKRVGEILEREEKKET